MGHERSVSRGKYGTRAAIKRDVTETETTIETYQRKVAALTAENKRLRDALTEQQRLASSTERRLRAERDEGTSDKLTALSLTVKRLVVERDDARKKAADIQAKQNGIVGVFAGYLARMEGLSKIDAFERVLTFLRPETQLIARSEVERRMAETHGIEAVRAMRQARGEGGHYKPANMEFIDGEPQ